MKLGPTVVVETAGDLVKFCRIRQNYIGFTFQGYIYQLVGHVPLHPREDVLDLSLNLEKKGHHVLLTASHKYYGVWTRL